MAIYNQEGKKKKMLLSVIQESGENTAYIFNDIQELNSFIFSPAKTIIYIINFKLTGRTYQERKTAARDLAIDFSNTEAPGLSYSELSYIYNFFEKVGRRYGLINEFKENAII